MICPDCGGPMWDNTDSKKNPKSPDYKCKSKTCGKGVWLEKDGAKAPARAADGPKGTLAGLTPQQQANARQTVRQTYMTTMGYVAGAMQKIAADAKIPLDMGHVQAATFSIYNTMDRKGLIPAHLAAPADPRPAPKREPEPPRHAPPSAPPPSDEDYPEGEFDDSLPF